MLTKPDRVQHEAPIFYVDGQSAEWTSIVTARARVLNKLKPPGANLERYFSNVWYNFTGTTPEQSSFTVIVPIHNEQRYLRSVLSSIMLSNIPRAVNAQILLITNACTDTSPNITNSFLHRLGAVTKEPLPASALAFDPSLDHTASVCRLGNITIKHLTTTTPGKANALTIGNILALQQLHRVALCLDANNWPHPTAIMRLFGALNKRLSQPGNDVAVVSGRPLLEVKHDTALYPRTRSSPPLPHSVCGCVMGWDTAFVEYLGVFPHTKNEDYALGVLARVNNKRILHAPKAFSWGYSASTVLESIMCVKRYEIGRIQLRAKCEKSPLYPAVVRTIKEDKQASRHHIFGKGLITQGKNFFLLALKDPVKATRKLGGFFFRRGIKIWARVEYLWAPHACTWEPIRTTK